MERNTESLRNLNGMRVKELVLNAASGQITWDAIKQGLIIAIEYHIPVTVLHNDKPYKISDDALMNWVFEQNEEVVNGKKY